MASTKEVLDHHLKCFAEGDLEGILFAPGAVLFTPDGPLKGAEAIRPLFQAMVAEFGKTWGNGGVWKTWGNVQLGAPVHRGRLCLHSVERRDCR
jgi:hypothetical protein